MSTISRFLSSAIVFDISTLNFGTVNFISNSRGTSVQARRFHLGVGRKLRPWEWEISRAVRKVGTTVPLYYDLPNIYLSHSILKQIFTLTLNNYSITHTLQSLFFLSSFHLISSFCFLLSPQFIFIYNTYLSFLYHSVSLHSIVSLLFTQPHMYISLITHYHSLLTSIYMPYLDTNPYSTFQNFVQTINFALCYVPPCWLSINTQLDIRVPCPCLHLGSEYWYPDISRQEYKT